MLSVFTIPFKVMLLRKTIFFELRIKRLQENSCVFREDISKKHDLREKKCTNQDEVYQIIEYYELRTQKKSIELTLYRSVLVVVRKDKILVNSLVSSMAFQRTIYSIVLSLCIFAADFDEIVDLSSTTEKILVELYKGLIQGKS